MFFLFFLFSTYPNLVALVSLQIFVFIGVLLAGVISSIVTGKLTVAGGITGGVLGLFLYAGAGWTGVALMGSFFVLGTAATSWKRITKERLGIAEEHKGKRTVSQVLANGGTGALLGLLAWLYPQYKDLFQLMMAAAFSSAAADTLSSELGSIYGRQFYNILSFKKDQRGLDGVVSLEGTVFGMVGSLIIATVYSIGFGWGTDLLWIVIAGTMGNLADSLLGALFERRGLLHNDLVNFLNTVVAALAGLLFSMNWG